MALIDRKQLAAELGIGYVSTYRINGLPCIHIGPRTVRFDMDRVREFLETKSAAQS